MEAPSQPNYKWEGLSNFVRTLPDRVLNELANNPVSVTLGTISALSVFAKTPADLRSQTTEVQPNILGTVVPENIISWVLVSLAVSFVLARLGAWITRRKFWSGLLFSFVFGTIAVLTSCYYSVEYLAPIPGVTDPLLGASGDFSDRARIWHGLDVEALAALSALIWIVNAVAAYGAEMTHYVKQAAMDETSNPDDTWHIVSIASGMLLVLSFMAFVSLSSIILNGVANAYVDQVLWQYEDAQKAP